MLKKNVLLHSKNKHFKKCINVWTITTRLFTFGELFLNLYYHHLDYFYFQASSFSLGLFVIFFWLPVPVDDWCRKSGLLFIRLRHSTSNTRVLQSAAASINWKSSSKRHYQQKPSPGQRLKHTRGVARSWSLFSRKPISVKRNYDWPFQIATERNRGRSTEKPNRAGNSSSSIHFRPFLGLFMRFAFAVVGQNLSGVVAVETGVVPPTVNLEHTIFSRMDAGRTSGTRIDIHNHTLLCYVTLYGYMPHHVPI